MREPLGDGAFLVIQVNETLVSDRELRLRVHCIRTKGKVWALGDAISQGCDGTITIATAKLGFRIGCRRRVGCRLEAVGSVGACPMWKPPVPRL